MGKLFTILTLLKELADLIMFAISLGKSHKREKANEKIDEAKKERNPDKLVDGFDEL